MDKQMSLSAINDELAQVRTKKKEFLEEIERIIPWDEWLAIIQPYYYKGERGNQPYNLERMFRIYLIENLYNLSDMATVTEANEHDVTVASELLTGDEERVYGDSGYLGLDKRPEAKKKNPRFVPRLNTSLR